MDIDKPGDVDYSKDPMKYDESESPDMMEGIEQTNVTTRPCVLSLVDALTSTAGRHPPHNP